MPARGELEGVCVAIDGSKFRAVNARDRNFTKGRIASRIAHPEADVERCLNEMVRVDRQEDGAARADQVAHLARRYGRIRQHIQHLQAMDRALADAPDGQISLTDPDARAMATSARNSGMAGYNVQTAVDAGTPLIVAQDVTSQGHDRDLLVPMAAAAKEALNRDGMHVLADRGYCSGRQILTCHEAGITTTIPRPETSGNRAKGLYVKAGFACEASADMYRCLAGEALTCRQTTEEDGLEVAPLPDRRLRQMRDEDPLHARQGTPDHAVDPGAPDRSGTRPPDQSFRTDDSPPQHRRAPLRHHQGLDGHDPFPDASVEEREDGNHAERPRLQHQADGGADRHPGADGRDEGMKTAGRTASRQNLSHSREMTPITGTMRPHSRELPHSISP